MNTNDYITHIKYAVAFAESQKSRISDANTKGVKVLPLHVEGYTSPKVKHLLNNLCSINDVNYLEIGVYKGATFTSAFFHNNGTFYGIDNWSVYSNNEKLLMEHIIKLSNKNQIVKFYDCDSFKFDLSLIKNKIDIYFYDGDHSYEAQKNALIYFQPVLSDVLIYVVDDTLDSAKEAVEKGTSDGIININYDIIYKHELPEDLCMGNPSINWWCGITIYILRKKQVSNAVF